MKCTIHKRSLPGLLYYLTNFPALNLVYNGDINLLCFKSLSENDIFIFVFSRSGKFAMMVPLGKCQGLIKNVRVIIWEP